MDKRFIMTQCRFHAIDRTQLFISGWFTKGDETSNKITVLLGSGAPGVSDRKRD